MTESKKLKTPTNKWVGDRIGYSESGASLLRRGLRQPTLPLMREVSKSLPGWPMATQAQAAENGSWTSEFEHHMRTAYTEEAADTTTNEENN